MIKYSDRAAWTASGRGRPHDRAVAHPPDAVVRETPMAPAIFPIDGPATGGSSGDLMEAQPTRTRDGGPGSPRITWRHIQRLSPNLLDPIP